MAGSHSPSFRWFGAGEFCLKLSQAFEGSLCVPDALYKTAFQLFDTNGNGTVCSGHILRSLSLNKASVQVSLDEFVGILSKTTLHQKIPFNFDCDFVKLYFGKEGKRDITYSEFSQFLHDFHEEWAKLDSSKLCEFCTKNCIKCWTTLSLFVTTNDELMGNLWITGEEMIKNWWRSD